MRTLFIGTSNPGKIREIASICRPYGVPVETVLPVGEDPGILETEDTFRGNAMIKAHAYAALRPGEAVMAEDSGIVVSALGGLPGPFSARFIDLDMDTKAVHPRFDPGPDLDLANNQRLLDLLRGRPLVERAAYFEIHMVVMRDDKVLFETSSSVHGWIAEGMRGEHGFGYDQIFVGQHSFGKTFAELDPHRKNLCSHRWRAVSSFGLWLATEIRQGGWT